MLILLFSSLASYQLHLLLEYRRYRTRLYLPVEVMKYLLQSLGLMRSWLLLELYLHLVLV